MTAPSDTVVVYDLESPLAPVTETDALLRSGASKVVLNLTNLEADHQSLEELFLELEAWFALERRDIRVLLAPAQKNQRLAKLISQCDVITGVVIQGLGEHAEAVRDFFRDRLYVTMPVELEP